MKEATKSLLFNGSWYYDNTAYQAIMNVSKEVEQDIQMHGDLHEMRRND